MMKQDARIELLYDECALPVPCWIIMLNMMLMVQWSLHCHLSIAITHTHTCTDLHAGHSNKMQIKHSIAIQHVSENN